MKLFKICSSVFLVIGFCALGYADEHFPFLAQVSKESVNIRAGANINFEILNQLTQGAELVVLGKSYDWYKVQLPPTTKVYIRADYLKIVGYLMGELIGDKVNIRAVANSDSSSLGILKEGELLKLVTQTKDWWQVEPPLEAIGWVRRDFLTVKSLKVDSSLIRAPIVLQEISKDSSLATIEVKGRLVFLEQPKADMRYKLVVDDKTTYYLQSVPNMNKFKGAMVIVKGLIVSDEKHQYEYPVLRTISLSLLL